MRIDSLCVIEKDSNDQRINYLSCVEMTRCFVESRRLLSNLSER